MSTSLEPNAERRFRPRFRLRTFLIVVTVFCVWLGWHIHGARRQREAVAAIRACGGEVHYDYQLQKGKFAPTLNSWAPDVARGLVGDDFFHPVVGVIFSGTASESSGADVDSPPIAEIVKLSRLELLILADYAIKDDDLRQLSRLSRLETLFIHKATGVTDEGVAHLSLLGDLQFLYLHNSDVIDPEFTCQLGDRSLEVLSRMPKLRTIRVWGTFTDEGVRHLARLEELRELFLFHGNSHHQNEITDRSLEFLLELPDFNAVDLRQTRATPELGEKILAKFPRCIVSQARR